MKRGLLVLCALVLALPAWAPSPAWAGVRVETRADGLKVITNEGAEHRARRFAAELAPVPTQELGPVIERYSQEKDLPPKLVRAVIQVESGYNPLALSTKGAMGLMQLTAATAQDMSVDDPYDPAQNVRGGTSYLRWLLNRFQDRLDVALAAYNAGPGAVERHGGIPPYAETRDYVRRVLALYHGREVAVPSLTLAQRGRTPYVVRDASGRVLITTDPPRSH